MSWEIVLVLLLLVGALASFIAEKVPTDVTSITVFAILMLATMLTASPHLPDVEKLISVFANSAPLTVAAMFIISAALERCGLIDRLSKLLSTLATLGYRRFLFVLILTTAAISAFVNNTPVVVVLMPIVLSLSRDLRVPASKLLIPLSYASIFGGICTTIGTSTNILVSGIMHSHGIAPMGMFEIGAIGLPLLLASTLYIVLLGNRLLPNRDTLTAILSEEERREYITEAFVRTGSNLIGKPLRETDLFRRPGLRVLEIIRDGVALPGNLREISLQVGDRLVLAARPSSILQAHSLEGVNVLGADGGDLQQIAAHEGAIVEGVIGPMSSIVDRTLADINFRQRYRMIVLAVHRHGRNVRDEIQSLRFQFGDTLLLMGTRQAIENIRRSEDVILLDRPHIPAEDLSRKAPLVLLIIGLVVATVSLGLAPMSGATCIAVAALLLTGCLKPSDAYKSIEWRILMLIYGMLGLGLAMEQSGLTSLMANSMVSIGSWVPPAWQPYILLALLYLCTSTLTEMLSNNAAAVLVAPLGIGVATMIGVDPRPFLIAICVGASASFATPIGYQTNTYVYGVGGYRFTDFLRIGIPLNLLYFVVCMALIPLIWPFHP